MSSPLTHNRWAVYQASCVHPVISMTVDSLMCLNDMSGELRNILDTIRKCIRGDQKSVEVAIRIVQEGQSEKCQRVYHNSSRGTTRKVSEGRSG